MLTAEAYMDVLLERQAEHATGHPLAPAPLLEAMVRPGDELLFTPPTEPATTRAPRPVRAPRRRVSATELRERRDRLVAQQRVLAEPVLPEAAAAHGLALGARRTARAQAAQDSRLEQWAALQRSIDGLDQRIRVAEAREGDR